MSEHNYFSVLNNTQFGIFIIHNTNISSTVAHVQVHLERPLRQAYTRSRPGTCNACMFTKCWHRPVDPTSVCFIHIGVCMYAAGSSAYYYIAIGA